MTPPRILAFAGSTRRDSFNKKLLAVAAQGARTAGAEVTVVDLKDFPMPLYDGDLEQASGQPANAIKLKQMMMAHQGVLIVSPEYNASVTPLLKNAIDWVSRVRERGEAPLAAYKNRVFALAAASDGAYGGMRSLMALRQILELGCGALVIPDQIAVMRASEAFDDMDNLREERAAGLLKRVVQRLTDMAREVA